MLAVDHEHGGKRSRRLIEGRWFSREDIESGAPVALISASEATRRFGDSSAIGKEVSSPANGALRLRVIGTFVIEDERAKLFDDFGYKKDHAFSGFLREVLEYSGVRERNLDWMLEPVRVLVPARSHRDLPVEVAELSVSPELLSPTVERLKKELVRKGMRPVVVSNLMVQVVFSETLDSLGGLHSALFLVAILAGVVVVANMHLLTMLERTREIAIRRVEGATRRLIAIQFIVETGTSCFIGSVLGVPLALGLAWFRTALEPSGSLHWSVPTLEIFQTVAAVTIAGIVGGLLPAYRAAKVEPIEVLSHD
ncbi:MAG: ABC transporter permease [Planctomycetota bacterium]